MGQLDLTAAELETIGFTALYLRGDEDYPSMVWHSIKVQNGEFIYNPDLAPPKWYFRNPNAVADENNLIILNIQIVHELYVMLSCFNADFNMLE
jgi:hypothetical protein